MSANSDKSDFFNRDSKVFEVIASLGVPGLVLWVLIATSGFAGGAALTSSLAFLGGPFGMLGGLGVLWILARYGKEVASIGLDGLGILLGKMNLSTPEAKQKIESSILPEYIKKTVSEALDSIDPVDDENCLPNEDQKKSEGEDESDSGDEKPVI